MFRVLWLALLLPSLADARPLSLKEALSLSVVHHPDVVESGLLRDQANAAVVSARSAFDPAFQASAGANTSENQGFIAGLPSSTTSDGWDASLGLQGTVSTGTSWALTTGFDRDVTTTLAALTGGAPEPIEQSTWSTSVEVSVTQDVLAFLRSSNQRNNVVAARERLDQAELSVLRSTQAAVSEVANAWWTWWSADATAEVARQSLAQAEALYAQTLARYREGEVARVEVDRVDADRLAAARDRLNAEAAVRSAADSLLVQIGLDPGLPIEIAGAERVWTQPEVELNDTLQAAMEANLQLAAARLDVTSARRALDDAKETSIPTLDLTGRAGVSSLTDNASDAFANLTSDTNNPYASVSLGLTVPLGGRAAKASRSDAQAALAIEELQLDAAIRDVTAQARSAVDAIVTAEQGVTLAARRVDVARATEQAEQARVDEGTKRVDELLQAMASRQSAEADWVVARVERARAELELASLEGRLLAEVLDVQ